MSRMLWAQYPGGQLGDTAVPRRNEPYSSRGGLDSLLGERPGDATWEHIEPEPPRGLRTMFEPAPAAAPARAPRRDVVEDDSAVKKFGSAKAISSAQFFGESESSYSRDANLSRFQGSSSISSAEYFGGSGGGGERAPSFAVSAPQLDEVRESVRLGVTRVAGRLSSLANGVVSSIQERYGY